MAASSKDIKAGGAWVELYAKDGVSGVLAKVSDKVKGFGAKLTGLGGLAAGASLIGTFLAGKNKASEIANLADELQLPIEGLSRIKNAADLAGVSIEELARHPWKYADAFNKATTTSTANAREAQQATRNWAVAIENLQNAMLPLLQVITPIVELLAKWSKDNPKLIKEIALMAGGIIAAGLALQFLGTAVAVVKTLASLPPLLGVLAAGATIAGLAAIGWGVGGGDAVKDIRAMIKDVVSEVGGGGGGGGPKPPQQFRETAEAIKGMFGGQGFTQQLGYGDTINPLRSLVFNTNPIPDMAKAVGEFGKLK